MCCSLKFSQKAGIAFSILFGLFAIAALIFAILDYRLIKYDWASVSSWEALGVLLLVSVVIAIVMMIFGIVEFSKCYLNKHCGITYVILQMIVSFFALAIGIMSIVASKAGKMKNYIGCQSKYKGILKMYSNIDEVLKLMDLTLCSDECPCIFNQTVTDAFQKNSDAKTYYDQWKTNGVADKFQDCKNETQQKIQQYFILYDSVKGHHLGHFKIDKFASFWSYVEEKFDCSGWCETKYTYNSQDFTNGSEKKGAFYKYLTSGVNRGVVKTLGCLESVLDWLPPKLLTYGILGILCSISGFGCFYLGLLIISFRPPEPFPQQVNTHVTSNNEEMKNLGGASNLGEVAAPIIVSSRSTK